MDLKEIGYEDADWIQMAQNSNKRRVYVTMVWTIKGARNFLTSWATFQWRRSTKEFV